MEGFLIDMRVRCDTVDDVDVLRTTADEFLHKAIKTDAALLYPPSIIAITACLVAASANGLSIDKYIMQYLFNNESDSEAFNNFKGQGTGITWCCWTRPNFQDLKPDLHRLLK